MEKEIEDESNAEEGERHREIKKRERKIPIC